MEGSNTMYHHWWTWILNVSCTLIPKEGSTQNWSKWRDLSDNLGLRRMFGSSPQEWNNGMVWLWLHCGMLSGRFCTIHANKNKIDNWKYFNSQKLRWKKRSYYYNLPATNTIYNKIVAAGLLQGNRCRRSRRAGRTDLLTTCRCAAESEFEWVGKVPSALHVSRVAAFSAV